MFLHLTYSATNIMICQVISHVLLCPRIIRRNQQQLLIPPDTYTAPAAAPNMNPLQMLSIPSQTMSLPSLVWHWLTGLT